MDFFVTEIVPVVMHTAFFLSLAYIAVIGLLSVDWKLHD